MISKLHIVVIVSLLNCITCFGLNLKDNFKSDLYKSFIEKNYSTPKEYYFLGLFSSAENFLVIIDSTNTPIYKKELQSKGYDFKIQENGFLTYHDYNDKHVIVMDSSFNVVDTLKIIHNYDTDFHDVKLLKNGHVILIGRDYRIVDMSTVVSGGYEYATVVDLIIQEFNETEELIFEWNSKDYFKITDTYLELTGQYIDYVHGNSIEIDYDGNFLLSSRNMSEVTKIDRTTGDIIWRLGGKNNEFSFINDTIGFSHQHTVNRLGLDKLTLFDNGSLNELGYSRGIIYNLDEINKEIELIKEYKHPDKLFAYTMGSTQYLAEGNVLIGWGNNSECLLTEFDSTGKVVFNLDLKEYQSYRAFRFPWKTNKFKSNIDSLNFDTVEYGNDSTIQIKIQNNSNEMLELSSYTNFNPVFRILDDFPININGNDFVDINIQFKPDKLGGNYKDILTINNDSYNNDLFQRIAIQIDLNGFSPDVLPPEFVSFPSNGSTNISVDTTIILEFNESVRFINDNEITNINIQDFIELRKGNIDGELVSFTALINKNKNKITITPDVSLNYSEDYYLIIDNQIEDYNDNALADTYFLFRTSDATVGIIKTANETFLFPNPAKDLIQINFNKKPQLIKISNMNGQLIYIDNKIMKLQNYKIDISSKTNGIYIVTVVYENGSLNTLKFIKN